MKTHEFPSVKEVIQILDLKIPARYAMDGDKIGLQLGDPDQPVRKILLALDCSHSMVIREAIEKKADLLVSHHALLYSPLKTVLESDPYQRGVRQLIKQDIAVYAAHTNWDIVHGGVNDILANRFGLSHVQILEETGEEEYRKLVVFIPETHLEPVRTAILQAGAGHIGAYSHCSFATRGEGTFLPSETASPFVGKPGELEKVKEVRVETVVPVSSIPGVVKAMLAVHPYEEVAYDLVPLDHLKAEYGIGRIGDLPESIPLKQFVKEVKNNLPTRGLRISGPNDRDVKRIAIVGGSGSHWITRAYAKGADVFITADLTYHDAQLAEELGITIVDPGHFAMEYPSLEFLKQQLEQDLAAKRWPVEIEVSQVNTDPFYFL